MLNLDDGFRWQILLPRLQQTPDLVSRRGYASSVWVKLILDLKFLHNKIDGPSYRLINRKDGRQFAQELQMSSNGWNRGLRTAPCSRVQTSLPSGSEHTE